MQRILREKSEELITIKQNNNGELPKGLLQEGTHAIVAFNDAKVVDLKNEKRPTL